MNKTEVLKTYFGYDSFRKGQENVIDGLLAGKDVVAIMPTGAGKSLCYQVPALLFSGITLVISPLISLMQDQVKSLNEAGVHAAYINSSLTETQISKALALAARGTYQIIYVAPERLESAAFMHFVSQVKISMVTVDEAHCISQWGQDFRPGYLKIVEFIESLPERPVVSAFTATATEEVKEDIACILKLKNPEIIVTGFDRENLYYSVEHIAGKRKDVFVMDYLKKHPRESGIIYCATRKNVDALYEILCKQGIAAARYHAGMDNGERKKSQENFIYDRAPVIVATNAFGMGIDKSNVRFVIHYNMPQSMENYYQEAGRAGRDIMIGKFLLERKEFEGIEEEDVEFLRKRDLHRLYIMEEYCKTTSCLRHYILKYFGERVTGACNNCGNCHHRYEEIDMTQDARQVINALAETKGRYGLAIVAGTLSGANRARLKEIGADRYKSYGALSHRSEADIRLLIEQMIREGYVIQTQGDYSVLRIGDINGLKQEDAYVGIRKAEKKEAVSAPRMKKAKSTDVLTGAGYRLFERMKQLRLMIAREEGMPPYIVFSDKTLIDMCAKHPETEEEMLQVSGVGENKLRKYGKRFLDEIAVFVKENPGAVVSMAGENAEESE